MKTDNHKVLILARRNDRLTGCHLMLLLMKYLSKGNHEPETFSDEVSEMQCKANWHVEMVEDKETANRRAHELATKTPGEFHEVFLYRDPEKEITSDLIMELVSNSIEKIMAGKIEVEAIRTGGSSTPTPPPPSQKEDCDCPGCTMRRQLSN